MSLTYYLHSGPNVRCKKPKITRWLVRARGCQENVFGCQPSLSASFIEFNYSRYSSSVPTSRSVHTTQLNVEEWQSSGRSRGTCSFREIILPTRMHSSRMRTVRNSSRLLGVPALEGSAPGGGVPAPGRGSVPGGCLLLEGGGIPACTEADPPLWTEWQTGVKT